MKLSSENKLIQMNKKYKNKASIQFKSNFYSKVDIQGWRNSLIRKLPKFKGLISADFGCGLGDKTAVLLDSYANIFKKAFLIDFSSSATKFAKQYFESQENIFIINEDAILSLEKIEDNSINIVLLFGFLHEIENRKKFLSILRKKLAIQHIVLVSDNDLYFNINELHREFISLGYEGKCYKRIFSFLFFKLFKSIEKRFSLNDLILKLIKGRTDSFFAVYSSGNIKKFY